jgi:hypothetical protein
MYSRARARTHTHTHTHTHSGRQRDANVLRLQFPGGCSDGWPRQLGAPGGSLHRASERYSGLLSTHALPRSHLHTPLSLHRLSSLNLLSLFALRCSFQLPSHLSSLISLSLPWCVRKLSALAHVLMRACPLALFARASCPTNLQWKVRRTLSYSIHEIALILGVSCGGGRAHAIQRRIGRCACAWSTCVVRGCLSVMDAVLRVHVPDRLSSRQGAGLAGEA